MIHARAFLLIALFFVDVHVRAESHTAAVQAEDPAACWGKIVPCAVQADGKKQVLSAPGFEMVLDAHSLVEQRNDKSIQLVSGRFLVSMKGAMKLNSPYAEFTCTGDCTGLFVRELKAVTLKALAGSWQVKRLGEPHRYRVDAGLLVTVAEVTENGMAEMEFPQSLVWAPTIKEWASMYRKDAKDFKREVTAFRQSWRDAVESASQVHAADAGRSIASHQASIDAALARRKREQMEDQRLRQLFRQKNHFD
jgi:hypothetical protein